MLGVHSSPFLPDWFPVWIDVEAVAYDIGVDSFHANTSMLCPKRSEIAVRTPSGEFFLIFKTLDGSLSSTGRSTRSSMGPVVPSSPSDLGSMESSRGPSLGGR